MTTDGKYISKLLEIKKLSLIRTTRLRALTITTPLTALRGYRLETGTATELRLALILTLTVTDTGFAVLTLLLGYRMR